MIDNRTAPYAATALRVTTGGLFLAHAALKHFVFADLIAYRRLAPFAVRNHPTEEHLSPLYVALGVAGEGANVERLHASTIHGVLRMDVYAFGGGGDHA